MDLIFWQLPSLIWILIVFVIGCRTTATTATRARSTSATIIRNIDEENVKNQLEGPPVLAESIQGTVAQLPCNVTPPLLDDRIALVIWYKVGLKTPIYSVDTRESNFSYGNHWSDEAYRERLSFTFEGRTGTLTIKSTYQKDTGEYRCRVDFHKSPTRNSKVNLTVIIPPESLIVLDSKGATVKDHTMGPYNEGSIINITCVAIGGLPQPRVTWWHDNILLDGSSYPLSERRVANVMMLGKLKRKNLHMQLTCQAGNNNLTVPLTSTVTLDMNLRPLLVRLQGENRPLSADNSYQLSCMVIGSRPAPTITWWKGSTAMTDTHEITNPDGNMTTSILTFTPTIDDRGKYLSCRAEQTMIPESGMEDGWKLDIYHIPIVSLELGTNSINSTFREGIDVFFECNIKSNPWIKRVSWRHNGNILENNLSDGIIVANQSLVLQNVSRQRGGIYTCVGSNREGDGESNPVHLDIRYAPVCRSNQRLVYNVGRHETAKVACEIEANPIDASYVWKFNGTLGETIDIPASHVAIDRGKSLAHYTPITENDYGTLICLATNEIGEQSEPCLYSIIPAGEPDPLINCTLLNQTSTGFQIECTEGFDGGLKQDFIMEVYANGTTRHPKIYKSHTPYFEVRGLIPGVGYNVFMVAQNSKGRSNATILQVYTLKDPEKQTDLSLAYGPAIADIRPFLGILLGIVGSVFLVALIIVIIVRMRGSSGRDRSNYFHTSSGCNRNGGLNSLHNLHTTNANTCQATSSSDSIDKNPDIIPQDGHDEEDEWTSSITYNHASTYATAALAEQNAVITSSTLYDHIIPTYAVVDKKMQQPSQQQQHHQQQQQLKQLPTHHAQYLQYNTLIPVTKITNYSNQQEQFQQQQQQLTNKTDFTITATSSGQHAITTPYCTATLGRTRLLELKRANEHNIYNKMDLAHHHSMYAMTPMFVTNTITGVTMSHAPQLATFTPSPAATPPPSQSQSSSSSSSSASASASASSSHTYASKLLTIPSFSQAHTQTQKPKQKPMHYSHSNVSGNAGLSGANAAINNNNNGSNVCQSLPPAHHTNQSIICITQKRPQSPNAMLPSTAIPVASSSSVGASTNFIAVPASSSTVAIAVAASAADVAANASSPTCNGSTLVGISSNGGCPTAVYTNESNCKTGGLLKTVPEEVVQHHLNGDKILIAHDRNLMARF